MKKNKKGISLIVLAITIIVMIILATAIVLSLTSNNMVDRAKEATNANDLANAKQLVMVAEAEWEMDEEEIKKNEGHKTFKQYAEAKLLEAGFNVSGGSGSLEVDEDANLYVYPTIPEGFVASTYEGEYKVSTGFVIYQTNSLSNVPKETAQTTYNQYVWVPVEDISAFERIEWGKGSSITGTTSYSMDDASEAVEYTAMKASVEKNGGFYIARYEAGKEGTDTLVSKKNATVWININWADSKVECETLSSETAISHLIYGEEWDAALTFIAKTDATYPTDSTGKGNYTRSLLKTGSNEDYAINNIYDMAGNAEEWTQESQSSTIRDMRGGHYCNFGPSSPASNRNFTHTSSTDSYVGFRLALYLK